jgi:mevalonate kinase
MELLKAPGKLLISAEYMVLHGSKALALPLNKGQSLQRIPTEDRSRFTWNAYQGEDLWFRAEFHPSSLNLLETNDPGKAEYLQRLLKACISLDPMFQKELFTWEVETRLDFSPSWGFGSSSTLTALMAEWADISPLDLHFMISEGSGYDVACAMARSAILYSLRETGPQYQPVQFRPPFASQIYFVWLGSKQPTARHLEEVASRFTPGREEILRFSTLTQGMLEASELSEFRILMEEHEALLSDLIKLERVSATRFPDLQGSVKSLGAWGGDFVMIASEQEPEALFSYLDHLGLTTRFTYKDLIYEA